MKKIILSGMALMICAAGASQSLNMDMTPLKTTLGKVVIDGVQIICFVFLIICVIGAAWEYNKDNQQAFKGFLAAIALTAFIWASAYIAKNAFL